MFQTDAWMKNEPLFKTIDHIPSTKIIVFQVKKHKCFEKNVWNHMRQINFLKHNFRNDSTPVWQLEILYDK